MPTSYQEQFVTQPEEFALKNVKSLHTLQIFEEVQISQYCIEALHNLH